MSFKPTHVILTLCLLVLSIPALEAFRPLVDPGKKLIQKAEENFDVTSHIELYQVFHIEIDGQLTQRRMFLMYQYAPNKVCGLWRILEEKDTPGITLHSQQIVGQLPKIFLHDPTKNISGAIEGKSRRMRFGKSNWFLEDIYDDDKEDWSYDRKGIELLNGVSSYRIVARYNDPVLKEQSIYGKRVLFLQQSDDRFIRSEMYDQRDRHFKTLIADVPSNVGTEADPQIRARRLIIHNHLDHSVTIMLRKKALLNQSIPEQYFTSEYLTRWTSEDDQALIKMLTSEEARSSGKVAE